MITPAPGRVVWFYKDLGQRQDQRPLAAIVTWVHNDRLVNLAVFSKDGGVVGWPDVPLLQDDEPIAKPWMPFAEWMPYQKGQAAKTEALEAGLVFRKPIEAEK